MKQEPEFGELVSEVLSHILAFGLGYAVGSAEPKKKPLRSNWKMKRRRRPNPAFSKRQREQDDIVRKLVESARP